MLRTVKLYGHLGKTFQSEWRLDVETPAEAVRAITANCPGFRTHLVKHSEPGYRVLVGDEAYGKEELNHPVGAGTIKIVPVIAGGGGDMFKIVVGVALALAAPYAFGFAVNALAAGGGVISVSTMGALSSAATFIETLGVALALSGVSGLLAPSPDSQREERPENKPSYAFNGPVNTVGQGNAVPVLYGQLLVGGQVISAGLSVDQIGPPLSGKEGAFMRGKANG